MQAVYVVHSGPRPFRKLPSGPHDPVGQPRRQEATAGGRAGVGGARRAAVPARPAGRGCSRIADSPGLSAPRLPMNQGG
jgi:hypothetical protein